MGYDDLCKSVIEEYRKSEIDHPNIGITEFANSIGKDFSVVWEILGFKDWYEFYDMDDG